jgi:hypothetical protein
MLKCLILNGFIFNFVRIFVGFLVFLNRVSTY